MNPLLRLMNSALPTTVNKAPSGAYRALRGCLLVNVLVLSVRWAGGAEPDGLAPAIKTVSDKLAAKKIVRVAVAGFTDLKGNPSELGMLLAEDVAAELLSVEGLTVYDPATWSGKKTSVGANDPGLAVLQGTVATTQAAALLSLKAVSHPEGALLAATRVQLPLREEWKSLGGSAGAETVADPAAGRGPESAGKPLAQEVSGDLTVSLVSVRRVNLPDHWGNAGEGIQVNFQLTNRSTAASMQVALNADHNFSPVLRGSLTDSKGNAWKAAQARGLSSVMVLGRDSASIADVVANGAFEDASPSSIYLGGSPLWSGAFTEVPPGQVKSMSVSFALAAPASSRATTGLTSVQVQCEFVVGTGRADKPTKPALLNFSTGDIPLP